MYYILHCTTIYLGKQITVQILCCKCESPSVTLIRHGLWPATPVQPKLAFTFEFMEWLRCLRLRAHASTHKFSEAVKSKLSNGPFNLLVCQNDVFLYTLFSVCFLLQNYLIFYRREISIDNYFSAESSL